MLARLQEDKLNDWRNGTRPPPSPFPFFATSQSPLHSSSPNETLTLNLSPLLSNSPQRRWPYTARKASITTMMRSGAPLTVARVASYCSLLTLMTLIVPPSITQALPYLLPLMTLVPSSPPQPTPTSAFMPWLAFPLLILFVFMATLNTLVSLFL